VITTRGSDKNNIKILKCYKLLRQRRLASLPSINNLPFKFNISRRRKEKMRSTDYSACNYKGYHNMKPEPSEITHRIM